MLNLVPHVIGFLKGQASLSEIGDRYYSPDFKINKDEPAANPKVVVRERWWNKSWFYRLQIIVRADSLAQTRELWISIINELENNYMYDQLKWQELDWWITDDIDSDWNIETFFYIVFYDKDSV